MPKLKSKRERRKSQRLSLVLTAKYRKVSDNHFRKATSCEDISGGGLGISLTEPLKINDKLDILLYVKEKSGPITAFCRVAWCKHSSKGKFRIGLRFIKMKHEQRFMEFLCEKIIDASLGKNKIRG